MHVQTNCTDADEYFNYPGTIRGLMEDACDVAFTKHETPLEVARDGTAPEVTHLHFPLTPPIVWETLLFT